MVVAYGHADALDTALAPLAGHVPLTVVDNSSSGSIAAIAGRHGADYLDPGSNRGFGAGVNIALKRLEATSPTNVLLLNPDAVIQLDDLKTLVAYARSSDTLAATAPRLLDADGRDERVAWPFPSPWRAWLEAFGLGRFLGFGRRFVIGAVLLLDWEAIREIGYFDERFFLYCEETDWQRRATDAGWHSAVCAEAVAVHAGAGTQRRSGATRGSLPRSPRDLHPQVVRYGRLVDLPSCGWLRRDWRALSCCEVSDDWLARRRAAIYVAARVGGRKVS